MIPVSNLFTDDPFSVNSSVEPGPGEAPGGRKRVLVISRSKKISFPPQPDDHDEKEVRDITPDEEVIKKDAIVRDPVSGVKVAVDEPPVIIRRKR